MNHNLRFFPTLPFNCFCKFKNISGNNFATGAIAVASIFISTVHAAEPVSLSLAELDSISAGNAAELAARVEGTANSMGKQLALAGVKTNAEAKSENKGGYRLDTVYASGVSYACCNGGTTTLDVDVSSDAETQVGFVRIYSIDSPLVSIKIGGGGIVGVTRL